MNNSNSSALGIIFSNSYDSQLPELTSDRSMASVPFASRYRMVDFILSSMVNSGVDNVSILVKENYLSLIDHLGSGREWDLTRKNGGLNIVPPFASKNTDKYNGKVEALSQIYNFLNRQKEKYVVLADSNIAINFDFKDFIAKHKETGADVTVAYVKASFPKGSKKKFALENNDLFYGLSLSKDKVKEIKTNPEVKKEVNLSINIYVVERELLIKLISEAYVDGYRFFERDLLGRQLDKLDVRAYEYTGYYARMIGMKSYFDESMKLLDDTNLEALFEGAPVYTKVRDDNPARYVSGATAKNVLVADGCVIEGEVENCILFRGVKIGKGAKVKNCILMQDTVVEEGAEMEYIVTDKIVTVSAGAKVSGTPDFPVYVAKGKTV